MFKMHRICSLLVEKGCVISDRFLDHSGVYGIFYLFVKKSMIQGFNFFPQSSASLSQCVPVKVAGADEAVELSDVC